MRFDYFTILKWGTSPSFVQVLKFDTAQPRNPAGSGRISGRWTKGAFVAGATAWSPKTSPPVKGGGAESQGGVQIPGSIKHTTYPPPARAAGESSPGAAMLSQMGAAAFSAPVVRSSGSMARMATSAVAAGATAAGQSPGHPASWSPKTSPPPATQPTAVAATNPEAHVQTVGAQPATPSIESPVVKALETNKVSSGSELGGGHVNDAFHVVMGDSKATEAVLKPEAGERWGSGFFNSDIGTYITNRQFSLAEREAFAYEVSRGLKNDLVPETVHRTDLNLEAVLGGGGGNIPDRAAQQAMYEEYKKNAAAGAQGAVDLRMREEFAAANKKNAANVSLRAAEIAKIWDGLVKDYPGAIKAGQKAPPRGPRQPKPKPTPEEILAGGGVVAPKKPAAPRKARQPALPLGQGQEPFHRKAGAPPLSASKVVDPHDALAAGGVVDKTPLSAIERARVTEYLKKRLDEGARGFGEVDQPRAGRELGTFDQWKAKNKAVEDRMLSEQVQSFDNWQRKQGFRPARPAKVLDKNSQAPHPRGGSLQAFKPGMQRSDALDTKGTRQLAVMDYVLGSMDRHGGNLNKDRTGHFWAIDNGYSMPSSKTPDGFSFRSAKVREWRDNGGPDAKVPEAERKTTLAALERTDWQALVDRHPNMNKLEREAFLGRVKNMKDALKTEDGLYQLWKKQDLMYA